MELAAIPFSRWSSKPRAWTQTSHIASRFFDVWATREADKQGKSSLVPQTIKDFSAMQKTWVWFLGWEDPLQKERATYFSILSWLITWTEKPGGLQSIGSKGVGHDRVTNTHRDKTTMVVKKTSSNTLVINIT